MKYEYENKETGEIVEKEYLISKDRIPDVITKDGEKFHRVWASSIHIPYQWGDTTNRPKYNKSPSRKKHYY